MEDYKSKSIKELKELCKNKNIKKYSKLNKKELIELLLKDNKKNYGQFYTKNYEYILSDIKIPEDIENIIEPFNGEGDLIEYIKKNEKEYNLECYDIEPKNEYTIKRDTLNNPPDYNNKYVITNPPYLARNKSENKELYDKYNVNDLYKCFIKELINQECKGGIIIIPLNFWSSIRVNDINLRKDFINKYIIQKLNIFEEQVFEDTTYTICSIQFSIKENNEKNILNITIYPNKKEIKTELNKENNYIIGGEIYKLPLQNKYKISRLTKKNIKNKNSNILVKCIDDNKDNQISLSYVNDEDIYIDNTPNESSRTYATLIIEPSLNIELQQKLVNDFNKYLKNHREKYNSLFLTNYRESKDIARKRISFQLVYNIVEYLLDK